MSRGLLPRKFSADDKVVPTRVNRYAFRTRAVTAFATYGKKELAQMPNIGVPDTQTNLIQTYFSYLPPNSRPETLWPISSLTRLDGFFMYIYIYFYPIQTFLCDFPPRKGIPNSYPIARFVYSSHVLHRSSRFPTLFESLRHIVVRYREKVVLIPRLSAAVGVQEWGYFWIRMFFYRIIYNRWKIEC